jgi:hypothetical protein
MTFFVNTNIAAVQAEPTKVRLAAIEIQNRLDATKKSWGCHCVTSETDNRLLCVQNFQRAIVSIDELYENGDITELDALRYLGNNARAIEADPRCAILQTR